MQKLILSTLILTGAVFAQSPLTTTFANNNGLSGNSMMWFDLTVNSPLAITQIDLNVSGTAGNIDFYTIAGSHLGNENSSSGWTLQGNVAVAAPNATGTPTPCTFATPFVLPPGNYGCAIAYNGGLGQAYTNGPNGPYSTAEMTFTEGGSGGIWGGIVNTPRTCNISIYYTGGTGNYATQTPFGTGCYDAASASFYESHTAFDLSNTSLQMTNLGNGYLVLPGTNAVVPSTSSPVTMSDDQVLPFALGWTLPYPGGTTTDLYVSSNGFVNLTANTASGCCSFNLNTFLTNGPVIAAKWDDLNPSAGGSVYFDTDPVSGTATVTFDMVPDYGSAAAVNTFQYYFDASGAVELRFGTVAATPGGTGWSPGLSNRDPGSIDISAQSLILTAPDSTALSMDADARPIIGNTINLVLDNVPTGAPLAAVFFGLGKFDPGIDLTGIGMPGCFQYGTQDAVLPSVSPGATITTPFVIPNNPSLAGVAIVVQGASFAPSAIANALGSNSSNGIELLLDVN